MGITVSANQILFNFLNTSGLYNPAATLLQVESSGLSITRTVLFCSRICNDNTAPAIPLPIMI